MNDSAASQFAPNASGKPSRWEGCGGTRGYGEKFAQAMAAGEDIYGEARLADVLAPRGARILDAGCGMGRIGGWLQQAGHQVVGVDLDAELLAHAGRFFPTLPTLHCRLDDLTPETLREAGQPTTFDVITVVGNVMILLAPESEITVLQRLKALLGGEGRILVGFHTDATPPESRMYSVDEFDADVADAGLEIESRAGTYDLRQYDPAGNYVVSVLKRPGLLG